MIFVAKNADFSAKNIGSVTIDFNGGSDDSGESGGGSSAVKVTMINIHEDITSLKVTNSHTFTADVYPANADDKTLLWSCSPTSCATINANTGELTAIKEGTVTVKAKATDGSNVIGTLTLEIQAKTKADCSALTKSVLNYYGTHHTDAQAVAVDDLINTLGGNETGSIWTKLKVVQLPCLANDINNAFINAKNGVDHMTYSASGKINATNNGMAWNCYTLTNGTVTCVDTSNTKNSLNIPVYHAEIKLSECSFITGGKSEFAGGTGCVIPIMESNKLYTKSTLTHRIGADYSSNCLKGVSVSYSGGYEATAIAPANEIGTSYGDQTVLNNIKAGYDSNGTEFHWNTYMRCYNQYYCFVLGLPLTQAELETACQAFDTMFKAFNVDQSV